MIGARPKPSARARNSSWGTAHRRLLSSASSPSPPPRRHTYDTASHLSTTTTCTTTHHHHHRIHQVRTHPGFPELVPGAKAAIEGREPSFVDM